MKAGTPYELLTGYMPNILPYLKFEWYYPLWLLDPGSFPSEKIKLGRWMVVVHEVVQYLCYWIFLNSTVPIVHSTGQTLTDENTKASNLQRHIVHLDRDI